MIETLPLADTVVRKKITQRHFYSQLIASKWSLPAILCLQALISLCTLRNTAFQDEALYLYAGTQIIHSWLGGPAVVDPYAQYFSGYLYFYPIIAGALNIVGGIEAARAFSLLCMLTITACSYYITKKFLGRDCAIWAAAILAFQAPILFLGRLATYDALCLLCLTLAMTLSMRVGTTRSPWWAVAIGPLLLLAIAAKYAGLLFVPSVFALLALFTLQRQGWRAMFVRLGLALLTFFVSGVVALRLISKDDLMGITSTTTNRVAALYNPPSILLTHIVEFSGIALLLGLLGLALLGWKYRLIPWLLFGSALLAPAYHLYKGELVSLDKHLAFGMVFIAPLMGYAVASIARYQQRIFSSYHWMSGVAVFLIIFSLGLQQSQYLYTVWMDSSNMTYMLETQIRPGSGRYLAEDYDVDRYYQQKITAPWQWSSLDYFQYADTSHQMLYGRPAYSAALHDGYFNVVELSFGYNAALATYIRSEIVKDHNYDLVAKVPYKDAYGTGNIWIWRKHVPS